MDSWMVDAAVEELQVLEAEHPDRFDYLKLDLKTFISQTSHHLFSPSPPEHAEMVDTQGSTNNGLSLPSADILLSLSSTDDNNRKRRRRRCSSSYSQTSSSGEERGMVTLVETKRKWKKCKKDRVDLALEKAAECLRKIRRLKETLAFC